MPRDLYGLGKLLRKTNRLGEAELILRRALAINEMIFGADHPSAKTVGESLPELEATRVTGA